MGRDDKSLSTVENTADKTNWQGEIKRPWCCWEHCFYNERRLGTNRTFPLEPRVAAPPEDRHRGYGYRTAVHTTNPKPQPQTPSTIHMSVCNTARIIIIVFWQSSSTVTKKKPWSLAYIGAQNMIDSYKAATETVHSGGNSARIQCWLFWPASTVH